MCGQRFSAGKFRPPSRPWPQSVLCRPGRWLLWRNFWWWTGQAPLSCGHTDACGPVVWCGMGAGVLGDPGGSAMAVSCLRGPCPEACLRTAPPPGLSGRPRGLSCLGFHPQGPGAVSSGAELPHLQFPGPFTPSRCQSPQGSLGQAPLPLPGTILTVLTCVLCACQ